MRAPIPGYAYALAAAVLFGASAPAAHALLTSDREFSPWLLAGVLYLGSGIGLALARVIAAWHGGLPAEASLKRSDLPWLLSAVTLGGVLGPVFLMEGLARMNAGPASLLLNLESVFTAGLAWFVFRENFDRRIFMGMVLILLGGVLLSWTSGPAGSRYGAWAIAAACLCWALDNNLTRKVSGSDAAQIAMIKGLAAGTTNLSLALMLGASWPPLSRVAIGSLIGFLGYGLSLVCFILALRQIGSVSALCRLVVLPEISRQLNQQKVLRNAPWLDPGFIGVGTVAQIWVQALEALTLQRNLRVLTLLPLENRVADRELVARRRRWCPACLSDDTKNGQPYGYLLWDIQP